MVINNNCYIIRVYSFLLYFTREDLPMRKKIVIIGGVAGGASAAARLRRLDENLEIIILEKGDYISFANCGLPYYIGNVIPNRDSLFLQTPTMLKNHLNIQARVAHEVIEIDKVNKTVTVKDLKTQTTYLETYDKLILSPGASPLLPKISGLSEAKNLFTLRNVPDTDKIKTFININQPKTAIIIGGGFIGLEMAENLKHLGLAVTIIEMAKQILPPLDFEMAAIAQNKLIENGITLILNNGLKEIKDQGSTLILNDNTELHTDLTILSIGVKPETAFTKTAALTLNNAGGIVVDEYFKTSDPHIYAVGDAIEVPHYITHAQTMLPLASPANRQGRLVADNLCGIKAPYHGVLGSAVVKLFDLTIATTGLNELQLQKNNLDYKVIHLHPGSHAGYYPNSSPISLKLLFSKIDGKIFGAQALGTAGVEKRIDVIATAIKGNLTIEDLADLELCYAPPFSSAKDPVNMAGYLAENVLGNLLQTFQWHELINNSPEMFLLDVREPSEHNFEKLQHSINIPLSQLRSRLTDLPTDQTIYVYCQVGLRGYLACRILKQHGFNCKNLDGGFKTYKEVLKFL